MGCFSCFDSRDGELGSDQESKRGDDAKKEEHPMVPPKIDRLFSGAESPKISKFLGSKAESMKQNDNHGFTISARTFTFRELASATDNFRPECFLGEGGFGRVYKGCLANTGQVVAVKQLDTNGLQGNREFVVEVLMLSLVHHPNLVNLIGYCSHADQRLLVYEFMPLGSLEDHLHDLPPDKEALDWNTRMKIAAGAAKGLDHLHNEANPRVIFRDFKPSNILLDEGFHPKLSDFGLAKLGPTGDKSHVSTRVMGTYGYCAPEYAMTGQLTVKSDIYSFGVVLLELITGRKAYDTNRPHGQQSLLAWVRPMFSDRRRLSKIADPRLEGRYPMRGLNQALAVASMCIQEEPTARPQTTDIVTALSYLSSQAYDPRAPTASSTLGSSSRGHDDISTTVAKSNDTEELVREDTSQAAVIGVCNKNLDREKAIAEAKMWGERTRAAVMNANS